MIIVCICISLSRWVCCFSLFNQLMWEDTHLFIDMSVQSIDMYWLLIFVLDTDYIMVSEVGTIPDFSELITQWKCYK